VLWRNMDLEDLAKRIREACLEAVVGAYDDAGIQGPLWVRRAPTAASQRCPNLARIFWDRLAKTGKTPGLQRSKTLDIS
jgi:hypothetical protein